MFLCQIKIPLCPPQSFPVLSVVLGRSGEFCERIGCKGCWDVKVELGRKMEDQNIFSDSSGTSEHPLQLYLGHFTYVSICGISKWGT